MGPLQQALSLKSAERHLESALANTRDALKGILQELAQEDETYLADFIERSGPEGVKEAEITVAAYCGHDVARRAMRILADRHGLGRLADMTGH